ncbi:LuxR C-terminal-related transcriptional regulator [Pseudonocardia halophobica]|uniref:LuxR C-terminal-related transcriptional regulator n=1 Tax=Pseudonocardia halophobica TaxID=29401 RepID=UPI003D8F7DC9
MVVTAPDHPDAPHTAQAFRPVGCLSDELRRARAALELADALAGCHLAPGPTTGAGPRATEAALDAAQLAIVDRLADPTLAQTDRSRLSAVLIQICQCRTAIREAETARRTQALPSVGAVMDRLRSATSITALLERAPSEVARVGYDRCLVSRVDDGQWIARSAYVKDDAEFAQVMVAAGSATPKRIDRSLLESELVRKRKPMLVTDPQRNPRVHRELITVTGTTAYVAAPIVVGRTVVAFVHADESCYSGTVDEFDREVLGVVTECIGFAAERAAYHERLQRIRTTLSDSAAGIIDMVDEMVESDLQQRPAVSTAPTPDIPRTAPAVPSARRAALSGLTSRELEVLERMADGDSNARIASALFITEATVKAHVKHIFRKLAVANRAEAVSRYLRAS